MVNTPRQFRGDRFDFVRRSRAQALFTPYDLGPVAPPVVRFRLGRYGGLPAEGDEVLHHTQNSPYVAVCLAAHLGARRIGLLGVDFTDHHFFAATGRHPLAGRLPSIDAEYGALARALAARGIELVNLSPVSRLTSLRRMRLEDFTAAAPRAPAALALAPAARPRRVFVVNYAFATCGDVFADGLRHAAQALGVAHAEAAWSDPRLPELVDAFDPDLLLVVHGRRFVQRWGRRFAQRRSAVWLVDEPYEVDDTAAWSGHFDTVFVNDATTLGRHAHAQLLPVAVDPVICHDPGGPRPHAVGFIGGANPTRERFLRPLAEAGLLAYVIGGPWRDPLLRRLCRATVVPHTETARLYQQTRVIVNVFRDRHHFNRQGLPATAINPRVVEALACGAAVVSERRSGIDEAFPTLPQFESPEALLAQVRALLADEAARRRLVDEAGSRLPGHHYAARLQQALAQAQALAEPARTLAPPAPPPPPPHAPAVPSAAAPAPAARPLDLKPLPGTPRRHLLYHLWPVRGSTWRWNVEQLLRRVELFNGRRVVAVALDERTESLATVREAFAGHGVELLERANGPEGESLSMPRLLDAVAGEGAHDVSFYGHAKGVKYEPVLPPAVRRWCELLYATALDDWPAVREQLDRFAMTGALRRMGRFANHHHVGDWHYSGTFFWFRHDAVFGERRRPVPAFYGGVEAWPGVMFSRHETGCLLLDNLRELPYHDRFWAQRGNAAFQQWLSARRPVPVPPDLLHPPPFEGHVAPRLEQRGDEFAWWLEQLLLQPVRRLLFVGGGHGGEPWHVARRFREAGRDVEIGTLCATPRPALRQALADAAARFGQAMPLWDSADALQGSFDAVFVDDCRGDAAVRDAVALGFAWGAHQVALHDIVDSDWHAAQHCAVSRAWAALRATHRHAERLGGSWGGIGVLHRPPA